MRRRLPFSALIELYGDEEHLQQERSYVNRNGSVSDRLGCRSLCIYMPGQARPKIHLKSSGQPATC